MTGMSTQNALALTIVILASAAVGATWARAKRARDDWRKAVAGVPVLRAAMWALIRRLVGVGLAALLGVVVAALLMR